MQKLTDDQRKMVEDNLALVTYTMKEKIQYVRQDDWDDVFQEGAIGLCRAAKLYNPEYGITFSSFAVPCITNAIYAHVRKWKTEKRRFERKALRMEDKLNQDCDEEMLVGNTVAAIEDVETEFACHSLMDFIKHSLHDRESQIVFLLLDGKTQVEIAAEIGVSQPHVSRIIKKIKNRIRLYRCAGPVKLAS